MILTGRFISGAQAWEVGICEKLVGVDEYHRHDLKKTAGEKEMARATATAAATTRTENFAQQEQYAERRKAVLDAALETAIQICNGAPGVVGPAMRAVKAGNEEAENEQYETILDTEDRLEALEAFYEKRKPVFRGR